MSLIVQSGITIGNGIVIGDSTVVTAGGGPAHTVAANGNARVSTAQYKFGTGSYTSNSLTGYLRVTPFTDLAFGTGDFTVEFWYRPASLVTLQTLFGMRPPGTEGLYPNIYINSNGTVNWYISAANRITSATGVLTLNSWNSIAVVRSSGSTKMYVNGNQTGSTYADTNNYNAGSCLIGTNDFSVGSYPCLGFIDEFRISNTARYTSNYTPATSQFWPDSYTRLLLHCDGANNSTTFLDSSNSV